MTTPPITPEQTFTVPPHEQVPAVHVQPQGHPQMQPHPQPQVAPQAVPQQAYAPPAMETSQAAVAAAQGVPQQEGRTPDDKVRYDLRKPRKGFAGEEIDHLKFRDPTGGDIAKCGYPFTVRQGDNGMTEQAINAASMTRLIAECSGEPESTIRSLSAREWDECAGIIGGFLRG